MTQNIRKIPGFSVIAVSVFLFLYAPMITLVIYSFNKSDISGHWGGFSWLWYRSVLNDRHVLSATFLSLKIAFFAGFVSTFFSLMASLAIDNLKTSRVKEFTNIFISHPLFVPEIVLAIALLVVTSFIKKITGYDGLGFILLAHSAFCIPLAYLPIRTRLESIDKTLNYAALDLYATKYKIFLRITIPLLIPGLVSGFILAVVSSLDNLLITMFLAGPNQETLSLYIYAQMRHGVTPELNAISTLFLAVSTILVSIFFFASNNNKNPVKGV